MANEQNLIDNSERSPNELRENGRRGGIKSGETRRRKKALKECFEILLGNDITDKNGITMSGAEAMAAKVFQQALRGDLRAFEIVRDTAGQKPVEKVMVADVDQSIIDEVEEIVKKETNNM